jgi:hypothetical protein
MDVIVMRTGVIRMRGDHALERRADDGRLRFRRAVLLPVVPRHRVHHGVRVQRLYVGIVRMIGSHLRHCVRISPIERRSR